MGVGISGIQVDKAIVVIDWRGTKMERSTWTSSYGNIKKITWLWSERSKSSSKLAFASLVWQVNRDCYARGVFLYTGSCGTLPRLCPRDTAIVCPSVRSCFIEFSKETYRSFSLLRQMFLFFERKTNVSLAAPASTRSSQQHAPAPKKARCLHWYQVSYFGLSFMC